MAEYEIDCEDDSGFNLLKDGEFVAKYTVMNDSATGCVVSEDQCVVMVATDSGQGDAGFELVSVDPLKTLHCSDSYEGYSSHPFFIGRVACVLYTEFYGEEECGWWAAGDCEGEAEGGLIQLGGLLMFDLDSKVERCVPIQIDLPEGWCPEALDLDCSLVAVAEGDEIEFLFSDELGYRVVAKDVGESIKLPTPLEDGSGFM